MFQFVPSSFSIKIPRNKSPVFLYIKQNVNSLCRNLFTDFLQFYRRRKSVQVFVHIKKVEMYGIEIPISTYRTQGAITFKVLSLKHTEISASRYFLCYKNRSFKNSGCISILILLRPGMPAALLDHSEAPVLCPQGLFCLFPLHMRGLKFQALLLRSALSEVRLRLPP